MLTASYANADQFYKAYEMAAKVYTVKGWTDWTDWYPCNINVQVTDENYLIIYSKQKQIYRATEKVSEYYDDYGGINTKFTAIDSQLKNCEIRIRSYNKVTQLYITYSNAIWVYNLTMP